MADSPAAAGAGPQRIIRPGAIWLTLALLLSVVAIGLGESNADAHTPHDDVSDVRFSSEFAKDGKVYVIAGNRLLVSNDGPYGWKPLVRGLPRAPEDGKSLAKIATTADPDILYVTAVNGGAFRTSDGGASWQQRAGGLARPSLGAIAASPDSPDVVLAGGFTTGFFRTVNGGTSWTKVPDFGRVAAIAFLPGSGRAVASGTRGRISISDDDGATWRFAATSSGPTITSLTASPDGKTVFAGTQEGGILRSDDGASTFTKLPEGDLPVEPAQSIAVSPKYAQDHTVWVSLSTTGVWKSTNEGKAWTRSGMGLRSDMQAHVVGVAEFRTVISALDASGKNIMFEAGFDGLFRSDNNARTWRAVETLVDFIVGIGVSPDYANDDTVAVSAYVKGAYISMDAGKTWSRINHGLEYALSNGNKFAPVRRLHNMVFSPDYAKDQTLFAATWTAFLKSTDRGKSWSTNQVTPPAEVSTLQQFVIGISPDYTNDRTIFLGTRQGDIFRSTEAGESESWKLIGNTGAKVRSLVFDPSFPKNPTIFAGTLEGVKRSDDAGKSWSQSLPGSMTMMAISPAYAQDGTIFAGTETGVYVSRDKARTWTELTDAPLSTTSSVEAISVSPAFADDGTVLVSLTGEGLFRSTDGGESFEAVGKDLLDSNHIIADYTNPTGTPIQFSPDYAKDRTIFAYAGQHVVKSTDRGNTWKVISLPSAKSFLANADPSLLGGIDHEGHVTAPADDGRDRGTYIRYGLIGLAGLAVVLGVIVFLVIRRRRRRRPTVDGDAGSPNQPSPPEPSAPS